MSRYRQGRRNRGITVKISPTNQSHLQNQAERMVGRIKQFLSPENVFHMSGKAAITELEADTLLSLLTHLLNNSPTHRLSEGCYFSPNDILACAHRIAINKNFPRLFDPENMSTKLANAVHDMEQIAGRVRATLFAFFLPLLRDDNIRLGHCPEGHGETRTIEDLTVGSIVCDYKKVQKSHTLKGSLARVEVTNKRRTWCIISGLAQDSLKKSTLHLRHEITSCRKHSQRGCMECMKRFVANERKRRENKGKDPVEMDIRVRRSDELFLIHREPQKGENDPVPRRTANRKAKEMRIEDEDIQYKIPPLDREFENAPIGEYLIPAEKEEIEKLKSELERQSEYRPKTIQEVITAESQTNGQGHAADNEEERQSSKKRKQGEDTSEGSTVHQRRQGARERRPPKRLQMPDWRR